MTTNLEAIALLNQFPFSQAFNDLQELILFQSWEGKSYEDIAESTNYDANYIRDVGAKVWKTLSERLNQRINKRNVQAVLRSYLYHQSLEPQQSHLDWENAIEPSFFYGRTQELTALQQWLTQGSQLISLLGRGGIGKTTLAVKFAQQSASQFEHVAWRSLHHALQIETLLLDLLQFLSGAAISPALSTSELTQQLAGWLKRSRCLIVLDNAETILSNPAYREVLRTISEIRHQSCLVLTSREMPPELELIEGARSLFLRGLSVVEGKALLQQKGDFIATETTWQALIQYYSGNPLALKMAAAGIAETFHYDIAEFLGFVQKNQYSFNELNDLLDQQFDTLSNLEQEVMYVLAAHPAPIRFMELQKKMTCAIAQQALPNTLKLLIRRSMIENNSGQFSLQPDVMDYVTLRSHLVLGV